MAGTSAGVARRRSMADVSIVLMDREDPRPQVAVRCTVQPRMYCIAIPAKPFGGHDFWTLRGTLVWRQYVTKGMYPLVPSSSIRDANPYTMAVTGPESRLRIQPGKSRKTEGAFSWIQRILICERQKSFAARCRFCSQIRLQSRSSDGLFMPHFRRLRWCTMSISELQPDCNWQRHKASTLTDKEDRGS